MCALQDERRPTKVTLTNVSSQRATFCVIHQASRQWWGQPDGFDAGLPDWLDAFPLHGCIAPQVHPLTTLRQPKFCYICPHMQMNPQSAHAGDLSLCIFLGLHHIHLRHRGTRGAGGLEPG